MAKLRIRNRHVTQAPGGRDIHQRKRKALSCTAPVGMAALLLRSSAGS